MDNPIVSIVIPVFNNAKLVRVMVDSIVAQDYEDWELLLVDDGSDEPTIAVLQRFSKVDGRIHLIPRNRLPKGAEEKKNCYREYTHTISSVRKWIKLNCV